MASNNTELNIWVKLKDDASQAIGGLNKRIEGMAPAFKKMTAVGGVALAGLTAFGVSAVKGFAEAEKDMAVATNIANKTLENMSASGLNKIQKEAGLGVDIFKYLGESMKSAGQSAVQMGFDDEQASISFAKLFSITNDTAQAQRELQLAMDLSRYSGKTLEESTQALMMVHAGGTKVLKEFGIEAKAGATSMEVLAMVQDKVGGSAEEMSKRYDVQLAIMQERLSNVKDAIGGVIVQALTPLLEKLTPLIEKFVAWAEENPKLITTILAVGAGIAGLLVVVGTLGLVLPAITAGFVALAGPIGIVIGIIAGLILTITNVVKIMHLLQTDSATIWEGIKIIFKEATDWIYNNSIGPLIAWIDKAMKALQNMINKAKEAVKSAGGSVKDFFLPGSSKASGGTVTGGTPYIVGENGREIFVPEGNGSIVPAGAGAGGINIYMTGNSFMGREDVAEKIGNDLMKVLQRNLKI